MWMLMVRFAGSDTATGSPSFAWLLKFRKGFAPTVRWTITRPRSSLLPLGEDIDGQTLGEGPAGTDVRFGASRARERPDGARSARAGNGSSCSSRKAYPSGAAEHLVERLACNWLPGGCWVVPIWVESTEDGPYRRPGGQLVHRSRNHLLRTDRIVPNLKRRQRRGGGRH
jgi:hypothetical protein